MTADNSPLPPEGSALPGGDSEGQGPQPPSARPPEATKPSGGIRRPFRRLWRLLCSLKFAVILMGLIAVACIIGTLIKQEPYDLNQAVARHGKRLGLLIGLLDLNRLYDASWFLSLLALFAVSTTACALSRLRFRLRSIGSATVHLSILFIVAGALARGVVGLNGYVTVQKGESVDSFAANGQTIPLGFEVRLDDFQVRRNADAADELLIQFPDESKPKDLPVAVGKTIPVRPDGTSVEVLQYLPHFMMNGPRIYSASDQPVNPAIQVRVAGPAGEEKRWLFAKYPDVHSQGTHEGSPAMRFVQAQGSPSAFESHVTVSGEPGREPRTAIILVNQPLRVGRFMLYQSGYDMETERSTTLEVVYDPGVPLVFTGFILMPLGMIFVFYIQPLLKGRRRPAEGKALSSS